MATGGSKPKKVDLQMIIETWATDYFLENASRKERSLFRKKLIAMEIDWKRVNFVHDPAEYSPSPDAVGNGIPTNHILYQMNFANRTDHPQSYSLRAERTTKSTCVLEVEQGYVTGIVMNVKVTTPCQIMELNGGFKREMSLVNTESQTIEEELTWGVDTQLQVNPGHIGEAKMIILEEEYKGGFEVKSHISGKVRVIFTNLKNNNAFIKAIERPIVDLVQEAINNNSIQTSDVMSVDLATNSVISKTKGKCHFRFGVKQVVEVDQKPIR